MPWAGQPSGVSPEETAEGPSRGLRGPCCYPDTPRLGPALRLPTGTLRARFSRCSRLQQRHRSLSILSHGRGGEGDDWRLLRLPVLTRSHTSRGAAHASELRRRALPPAFVSAPFFLPLGGSWGGGPGGLVHRLPFRLAARCSDAHSRCLSSPFSHPLEILPAFQSSVQIPPPPGCLLRLAPPTSAVLHSSLSVSSRSVVLEDGDEPGFWLVLP